MQLFYSPTSPYARNTLLVARHHQWLDRLTLEMVNPLDDPRPLREANPLGKVPSLVLDDGRALFDSTSIIHYFNHSGKGHDLFNLADAPEFEGQRLYGLALGVLDHGVAWRLESVRPENEQSAHWQQRRRRGIEEALACMEQSIYGRVPHIDVENISIVEIAFGVSLDYLDFRLGFLNWADRYPALADWVRPILSSDAFCETDPRKA